MSSAAYYEASAQFPYLTTTGHDHLAWAKRILHREERGDKTVMPIQARFAREALNRKADAK